MVIPTQFKGMELFFAFWDSTGSNYQYERVRLDRSCLRTVYNPKANWVPVMFKTPWWKRYCHVIVIPY